MEVLGLPNGVCEKLSPKGQPHGPKLLVNGEPKCLKCESEASRAARTHVLVNTAKDPGHEAMKNVSRGVFQDREQPLKIVEPKSGAEMPLLRGAVPQIAEIQPRSLEEQLGVIRDMILTLPMPKSLKQYKRLQKITQLIEQTISEV